MQKLSKFFIPVILIIFGVAIFIRGISFVDPDFGWHLREGQLIIQSGIPVTDPFSYSMPSYHLIDHEWLTNILTFLVYKNLGIDVLSAIFAFIFVLALFFAVPKKLKQYASIPLLLGGSVMIGFAGIRTQEITWLFFALLLKIIFDEDKWRKWKFFLPLIFLPWANLHGGFAIGIAILFVVFIAETLKEKRIAYEKLKIFLMSLVVTFINPYGPRIWYEIWSTISDTSLRWTISEWTPGVFYFDLAFCILIALSLFLILVYRAKIPFFKIAIYFLLLFLAISSARNVPLWAICAILLTSEVSSFFITQVNKNRESVKRFEKVKKIFIVVFSLVLLWEINSNLADAYNLDKYPQKAVNFLEKQHIKGNIFSTYSVGGYLIWKLPGKRVFIDGRMPSWRRTGNYPNESNYAFKDYMKMVSDDNFFKQEMIKYNISYVLFPAPSKGKDNWLLAKAQKLADKIFFDNNDFHVLAEDLTKIGLSKVYGDGQYVIYKR